MKNDFKQVTISIPVAYYDMIKKMFPVSTFSLAVRYIISYYFQKNLPDNLSDNLKESI